MVSSKFVLSALLLLAVSAGVYLLQIEWVYATFLVFIAALLFAYSGGWSEPAGTMTVRHAEEGEEGHGNESPHGNGHGRAHGSH